MSAFIILSFSRRLQIPTKLISAFYSTLETPISASPSFETTPIASFLLNDCGFSLHAANAICKERPDLLARKSYDNAQQTLHFLGEKGVNEIGVRKLISLFPSLLRCKFQDTVKPKVELLEKIGLTGQKLLKTLHRYPRIFRRSSRTLEQKVWFLQSVLDPDQPAVVSNSESDQIPRKLVSNYSLTANVISQFPRILSITVEKGLVRSVKDVEGMGIEKGSKAFARAFLQLSMLSRDTVKRKLENLRELGFTEEEVRILVRKSPTILGLSEDTVKRKLENLSELGFTEEEVRILVRKFPTILGFSEDTLRQQLKFLVEEWKLPRNVILSNPVLLGLSMEKRLKPRLNAVKALMMMNKSPEKALSHRQYLMMSSGDFHRKVVSRLPVVTKEKDANPL